MFNLTFIVSSASSMTAHCLGVRVGGNADNKHITQSNVLQYSFKSETRVTMQIRQNPGIKQTQRFLVAACTDQFAKCK